jgi:ribose/xylose/arabinose/galactoside ABC-type transport system permease subunit
MRLFRAAPFDVRQLDVWFLAGMTIVAIATFAAVEPGWLDGNTLQSIITQNGPLAIVSAAMTFSIISRHIDLSPGSMLALSGVVIGLVYQHTHSLALGLLAGLGLCLVTSAISGLLVTRLGLSAIIITLATYIWARGLAVGLSGGKPIVIDTALSSVTNHTVAGFTVVTPIVLVVYLGGWLALTRTRLGRYTHAMGGDPAVARRAGIRTGIYTVAIFSLMGMATWLSSVLVVGQLQSAQPYASPTLELDSIIAVIIGGSRLAGGEGGIGRTLLGVAFLSVLTNGLLSLGLSDSAYQLYEGSALLAILSSQILIRRRADRIVRRRLESERSQIGGAYV